MHYTFPRTLLCLALLMVVGLTIAQDDGSTPTNPLEGTLWQLEAFEHPDFPADEPMPRITLGFYADGSSGGHGGCNVYGSGYTTDGESITFEGVFSTMMACMEGRIMAQEIAYTGAISNATRFEIVVPNADAEATATPDNASAPKHTAPRLHLYTRDGEMLVFAPYVNFANTAWELVRFNDETPNGTTPLTLELNEQERASGFGGCNRYNTSFFVSSNGMLSFGVIASTRMACVEGGIMAQEQAFFDALATVAETSYNPDTQELTLTSDAGTLTFVPVVQK